MKNAMSKVAELLARHHGVNVKKWLEHQIIRTEFGFWKSAISRNIYTAHDEPIVGFGSVKYHYFGHEVLHLPELSDLPKDRSINGCCSVILNDKIIYRYMFSRKIFPLSELSEDSDAPLYPLLYAMMQSR
jgi:hypothetical protein